MAVSSSKAAVYIAPLALLAVSLLGSSLSVAAPPPDAPRIVHPTIVRGSGRVRPSGAQPYAPAGPGTPMTTGTTVESSPDEALEILLPDGVRITMEPGSLATWMTPGKLPSETNTWAHGYALALRDGEVEVRMPEAPKGSHAFLVSTTAGTLTDWRGKLHLLVHHDTTAAAIYEGALVVGSNGHGFPVYDGAAVLMRKGINPDRSRTIPPAPAWRSDAGTPSFAVVSGASSATLGFAWDAVPGAATYRVAVADDPQMQHVFVRAAVSDTSYVLSERTAGTAYFAQVRAVTADGIVGEWSTPRPLRVLHYSLPDGGVVGRDGALVIPPRSSVMLSDTDGVEVAYEDVRGRLGRVAGVPLYWSKLTGALRLPEDVTTRIVHLRDVALGGSTTLVLARRQLRADVDLSPADPAPGVPLTARVVVWDPSGRIDPGSEAVSLRALRDIDPIPVAWQRSGNTWTARIDVGRVAGPTVVRVVVTDSRGIEIGRGFLEIGGTTASAM
jgi:hypothetical protein